MSLREITKGMSVHIVEKITRSGALELPNIRGEKKKEPGKRLKRRDR